MSSSLVRWLSELCVFFFFNDTATTEIYTLSLHDALPILVVAPGQDAALVGREDSAQYASGVSERSEEHTSELQSQSNLVCRLLLEKKKKHDRTHCTLKSHAWERRCERTSTHSSAYER